MTDYDAEDRFEQYLCFSAMLSQRLKTALEQLDTLSEYDDATYIQEGIQKVLQPVYTLMTYRIRTYPYSLENLAYIHEVCAEKTREFLISQRHLFAEVYTLLPLVRPVNETESEWITIKNAFDAMITQVQK